MASETVTRRNGEPPPEIPSRDWRLHTEHLDATRYLCAGAYLDEDFSRRVLAEVLYQPHRGAAPSYGINLALVLLHAIAAQRRALIRDGAITAVFVVLFFLSPSAAITLVALLLSGWLLVRSVRLLLARDLVGALISFVGFSVAWAIAGTVGLATMIRQLWALIGYLALGPLLGADFWDYFASVLDPLALPAFAFCVIWAVYLTHRLNLLRTLVDQLGPGKFDPRHVPPPSPTYAPRVDYVAGTAQSNLTVYSMRGDVRPFVGSGVVVNQWAVATPLVREARNGTSPHLGRTGPAADQDGDAPQLTARILYDACRRQIVRLALEEAPLDVPLEDLTIEDHLFVAGVLPPNSPLLDRAGRPLQRVDQQYIDYVSQQPRGAQRHYLTIRTSAWGGEVVVNGYFHVSVRGGLLYVEFVATALPGIAPEYHAVDTYERLDSRAFWRAVRRAYGDVFTAAPLAPVRLGRELAARYRGARNARGQAQQVARQIGFDYGAHTSVRELGVNWHADPKFQNYDTVERVALLSRRLLETVVDVARAYGYSVSDLERQATTVVTNISDSIFGSSFANSAVAFGTKATATNSPTAAPHATPPPAAQ